MCECLAACTSVHHLYAGKPERMLQTVVNWKCCVVAGNRAWVPVATSLLPIYITFIYR